MVETSARLKRYAAPFIPSRQALKSLNEKTQVCAQVHLKGYDDGTERRQNAC